MLRDGANIVTLTRRNAITLLALPAQAQTRAPIVNAAEHAWVANSPRFPMTPEMAVCPASIPKHEYSAEFLLSEMKTYSVDHVVISHVCYYGRDNSYASHCVKTYPGKFAAIGLLVGHRLHDPADKENPSRLERLVRDDGLIGLRLSPIYNRDTVWLNDPACYPLWKMAEKLGATFNIFLAPHQVRQVGGMAQRFPGVNVVIDHLAMIDIAAPDADGFGPLWANFFEYAIMKDIVPFFTAGDKVKLINSATGAARTAVASGQDDWAMGRFLDTGWRAARAKV